MARIDNLENFLTDVASSIKNKKGITGNIPAANFDTEINSIVTGSVVEKVVAEANEIIEEPDVVKIISTPIEEPVVIPENGKAEVLADKNVLAENIGITPNKVVKGECILGINGKAETGVMTQEEYARCDSLADNILNNSYSYELLEYIITNTNSCFEVPYKYNSDMSYEIEFEEINTKNWGVYMSDRSSTVQVQKESDIQYYIMRGDANYGTYIKYDAKQRIVVRQDKENTYFNNALVATIAKDVTFSSEYNICINNVNPTSNASCNAKLYKFRLWDDDRVYCNLIPAKRSDGSIGMLDTVTKQFFVSIGESFEEGGAN